MLRASWKLLLLSRLVLVSCVNDNIMVRDYFVHKGVSNVVGFSCGSFENDVKFAKTFNDVYILTSMWNLESVIKSSTYTLRKLLQNNYHNLGVYVDARCHNNYTIIYSEATKYFMYDETHKWLIVGRQLNDTVRLLNDNAFGLVTDVTLAIPSLTGYDLYDVYNPCKERGGSLNVTALGYWTEKSGVAIRLRQSKYERRSNLYGMKLRVGILLSQKLYNSSGEDIMMDPNMKAKYGRSRFLFTLLSHMADLFNFTIEIVEVDSKKRQDNSAPIFIAFQRNMVDVSASPIVMKAERLRSGDIIGPVWPMRSCFLFRTISSANMRTKQFLRPLDAKVWYVVFVTMFVSTSILAGLLVKQEGVPSLAEGYNISILITLGAFSQQGSVVVPVHYAGRIAFLHIMLFSVLMLNYYSASVVSDRLKNVGVKMNDSLISLTNSNLKVAAEPTPYFRSFLQSPEEEVRYFYVKRWDKLPEAKRYLPLAEGLDRVAKGGLAYHTSIDSAYPYIERHFHSRMICELTEVHLFRAVLALWAKHRSPFTQLLKIGLAKMYDVGIRKRQLKRWSARKPFCPKNTLVAEPLSIHEAAPIFAFITISTMLSFAICIIENLVHWLCPTRLSILSSKKLQCIQKNLSALTKRISNIQNKIYSRE